MILYFIASLYIFVPIAYVVMFKNYRPGNWLWLVILTASLLVGASPIVAGAYLITFLIEQNKGAKPPTSNKVSYGPDGSYVIYPAVDNNSAPSIGKVAFKVVGGVIGGLVVAAGLLLVGIIIWLIAFPPILTGGGGGGGKTM